MEGPPQTSTLKLKLFFHSRLTLQIFRIGIYKGGFDKTKFESIKMKGPFQTVLLKFKIFNCLNQNAKFVRISKYERLRMAKYWVQRSGVLSQMGL